MLVSRDRGRIHSVTFSKELPRRHGGKEPICQYRRQRTRRFDPWAGKVPCRRKRQPTPVCLPGKPREQRGLAGYSLWGHKEPDMT